MSPPLSARTTASLGALRAWRGLPLRWVRARWRMCSTPACGRLARSRETSARPFSLELNATQFDFARAEAQEHVVPSAREVRQGDLTTRFDLGACRWRRRTM